MKIFHFDLERVLGLRRQQQEQEQMRLDALLAEAHSIEVRRQHLITDREQERAALFSVDGGAAEYASFDRFHRWTEARLADAARAREDCARRIQRQRATVLTARRAVRLLERLRQKRQSQWQYEYDRELDGLAGELYLARWRRE